VLRGPESNPGGSRERLALGVLLVLGGALLAALGSAWGWLAVAIGAVLVLTAFPSLEDADRAGRTTMPDADPIEPDEGVPLQRLVPLAIAALVVVFKFGAIALFALRAALASTDYLPVEVRGSAPAPLKRGDLVLVRREADPALAPGRVVYVDDDGRMVLGLVRATGPDTVDAGGLAPLEPGLRSTALPEGRVHLDAEDLVVEAPARPTPGAADGPLRAIVVPRRDVYGPAVAVVFPIHRWRGLR
jgi:hypothetical protein